MCDCDMAGRHRFLRGVLIFFLALLGLLAVAVAVKAVWVRRCCREIGSFESEKSDILERRAYLAREILVEPDALIEKMPSAVGPQFQGEWALYSCSMFTAALVNIARLYPETRAESVGIADSLIRIVLSPALRQYDSVRWGRDAIMDLDGDDSHVSYLSHLAWMIGGYETLGGDDRYEDLYGRLCEAMNRRICGRVNMSLETYPDEPVYVPDMLVAIVALAEYSRLHDGDYCLTVSRWLEMMKNELIDEETGLVPSLLSDVVEHNRLPLNGSYTALSCYYLTFIDRDFAEEQYRRMKRLFIQEKPLAGMREYHDRDCTMGFDIDAGPIIMNLSPSGTAFALGPVTYFGDMALRTKILRTAEIAGSTIIRNGERHYLLADIVPVGEAIALAMRTALPSPD